MLITHLARFQLERLAADMPQARVAPALRVHVGSCDQCGTRLRALVAARAQFLSAHPAVPFACQVVARAEHLGPERKLPWWLAAGFVHGVVVALALTLALLGWLGHDAAASWSRASGVASFRVFATRGAEERRVRDGDTLARGNRLAFEYSLERPRYFMLLGIDATGAIVRYLPESDDAFLSATSGRRLSEQIDVGSQRGDERLYALFASEPLSEVAARHAIARAVGGALASGQGLANPPRPALQVEWISVGFRNP
jgi:hypothetical protein